MKVLSKLVSLILLLALLITPVVLYNDRLMIFDWFRLRNYIPSSQISKLADETTMNTYGRHLFYVYHPSLESKLDFNGHCSNGERTIVLGCYISRQGIYIYDIQDSRLNGVEDVTAAHEMLHAGYERLNSNEKQHIDNLVTSAFSQVQDKRVRDTIEEYRKQDPSVVPNELHSILGTEVMNLPPELEAYYTKFFSNRKAVVAFSQKYEQAFTLQQQKVTNDDGQLKILKAKIDNLTASLDSQLNTLNKEKAKMDQLLASKQTQQYNDAVPGFNAQVVGYNNDVATARSLIDQYNNIVKDRNNSALEENELIKAIDSRPNAVQTK